MGGFQLQLAFKSKKVIQKIKKLHEIRKVVRRTKNCSKSEKLPKSCRVAVNVPADWLSYLSEYYQLQSAVAGGRLQNGDLRSFDWPGRFGKNTVAFFDINSKRRADVNEMFLIKNVGKSLGITRTCQSLYGAFVHYSDSITNRLQGFQGK